MPIAKIAISIDQDLLRRLDQLVKERRFPNRSRVVQEALQDKLERLERSRLARECAKLDPRLSRSWPRKAWRKIWSNGPHIERRHYVGGSKPGGRREQAGHRPVVIISEDVFNARSGTMIAVALTSQSQRAGFPLTLELTSVKLPHARG